MTFSEQAKKYMVRIQTRRRNPAALATINSYQSKLDKWLLPFFGQKNLSEIDNGLVRSFVQRLSESDLSASTINVTFSVLKQIVASAVDENGNRLYERSWNAEFLDLPVISPSTQKAPCASPDAIQGAIKRGQGQDKALYALLAGTGLRIGECLALMASDWDRQNMTLSVTKTIVNGRIQDSTKTVAGTRIVDLTPELNAFLIQRISHTDGLLFRSATGGVVRQMSAYDKLEKTGIPGFHSLRRFRETYLETVGVPRMLMKFWTGHAASDISERYIKFGPDVQARKQWAVKAGLGFSL